MKPHVFVFGSNLAGRHGAGSAKEALKNHGAIYGQGIGRQGNSYAIPTKGRNLEILSLDEIRRYVSGFLVYAGFEHDEEFDIVAVGCGLSSYKPEQIAPMFRDAPANCRLPKEFLEVLGKDAANL